MSFKTELLELRRQHHVTKRRDIKPEVDKFFLEHKSRIEDAMKMSADNGYTEAAYYAVLSAEQIEEYSTKTRDLFTKHLCELLEQEYPDIKFDGRGFGEIVISWSE